MIQRSVSTWLRGMSRTKFSTYSSAGDADELLRRPELHDRAVAHDRDPVAEPERLRQVVRDEDHRLAGLAAGAGMTSSCMSRRISGSSALNGSS